MIPKIIHYCWFGHNQKPKSVLKYINTWKKYLPDYEFKEWNENNFDIDKIQFVKEAYINKKYAFVSDVCRLYALYSEGGIYFDTDVEVVKKFDPLLFNNVFMGMESDKYKRIGTSVIGAEPNNPFIAKCLEYYTNKNFINSDGSFNTTPNTLIISDILAKQENNIVRIYPIDYFSPIDFETKCICKSSNTYSIHHFSGTWLPQYRQLESRFWSFLGKKDIQILYRIFKKIHIVK